MVLNFVIKVLLYVCLLCTVVMVLPGGILLDVQPKKYPHNLPKSLEQYGNNGNGVKVIEFTKIDSVPAPESIATFDGKLVTGTADGMVVQILPDDTVKPLVRIINEAETTKWNGTDRGRRSRPLGMRFDIAGTLFVVEPYYGVYKVENIFTGQPKVTQVFDIEQTTRLGRPASRLLDDLVLVEEPGSRRQTLYITDVSRKFTLDEQILIVMGSDTTGRLLRYDIADDKLDVVLDQLFFPNGLELTADGSALLLAESATRSVWKVPISGDPPRPAHRIMENLPAEVDNIRLSATGHTYWLALLAPRTIGQPADMDYFLRKPLLRKLLLRTYHLTGTVLEQLARLLSHEQSFMALMARQLKTMRTGLMAEVIGGTGGMLLEIDSHGNILNGLYSAADPEWGHISEAREVPTQNPDRRLLYLGSFCRPYLRKIVISS